MYVCMYVCNVNFIFIEHRRSHNIPCLWCMCMYVCMHLYICMYVCLRMYVYMYVCIYVCIMYVCIRMYVYIYV